MKRYLKLNSEHLFELSTLEINGECNIFFDNA